MGFIFRSCMLLAFAIIMWGIVYLGYWVFGIKMEPWQSPDWWMFLILISGLIMVLDFSLRE